MANIETKTLPFWNFGGLSLEIVWHLALGLVFGQGRHLSH
jgi:hypothetical protein